jgi:hypothetical protein
MPSFKNLKLVKLYITIQAIANTRIMALGLASADINKILSMKPKNKAIGINI